MTTAGMAAASPNAVASSASAIPGATTARFVVCDFDMPMKLFMMPHTVPNRPTKGEVAPTVVSTPMPMRMRRAAAREISAKLEAARARRMLRGTSVLATIGATAPFVGLFGTVWGIMNSFIGISKAAATNLAIVAPGIAEALLATAFGLAAAIPAVVAYNRYAHDIDRLAIRFETFIEEFSNILQRQAH